MIVAKLKFILLLLLGAIAVEASARDARLFARDGKAQGGFPIKMENRNFDETYHFHISVGTPASNVRVRLGTGQRSISLYNEHPLNKGAFTADRSSTFKLVPGPPDAKGPGTPSSNWRYANDKITVGNESKEIDFWSDGGTIQSIPTPNTFGIDFPSKANDAPSFWGTTFPNWADKEIGLFFSRHAEERDSSKDLKVYEDSEIMVGGVNRAKFTGDITYHPFTPGASGAWVVPLEGISVDGNAVDLRVGSSNATAATNGTAAGGATPSQSGNASAGTRNNTIDARIGLETVLATFPPEVLGRILKNIPDVVQNDFANQPYVPCEAALKLDIRVTVGGKEWPIKSRDLVGPKANVGSDLKNGQPVQYCQFYLASDKSAPSDYVLSTAFLKNVYTALRFDPPAVGFAQLSDNAQPKVKPTSSAAATGGQYLSTGAAGVAAAVVLLFSV